VSYLVSIAHFLEESAPDFFVSGKVSTNGLDRDIPFEKLVVREIDLAHAPKAENFDYSEPFGESVAGREPRRRRGCGEWKGLREEFGLFSPAMIFQELPSLPRYLRICLFRENPLRVLRVNRLLE
jgi:hypothetical protein